MENNANNTPAIETNNSNTATAEAPVMTASTTTKKKTTAPKAAPAAPAANSKEFVAKATDKATKRRTPAAAEKAAPAAEVVADIVDKETGEVTNATPTTAKKGSKAKPAAAATATQAEIFPDNMFAGEVKMEGKKLSVKEFRDHPEVTQQNGEYRLNPRSIIVDVAANPRKFYDEDKFQVNKESIKLTGVQAAVQIAARKHENGEITFHLQQGFNRMRAVMEIIADNPEALQTIPVTLKEGSEEQNLLDHITYNRGQELRPIEVATIFLQLERWGNSIENIYQKTGVKVKEVKRYLDFMKAASQKVIDAVINNQLAFPTAEALVAKYPNPAAQNRELDKVIAKLEAEAGGNGPKKATARHFEGNLTGKINFSKSLNSLSSFIDEQEKTFPEEVNTEKVKEFKQLVKMMADGKTPTEIFKYFFASGATEGEVATADADTNEGGE